MRCRLLASVLGLALSSAAVSQEQRPIVRVEVTPQEVLVGESAQMRVTVLVPTWFPKPPDFPSFELPNLITRLPPDSSFPTRERIGGAAWSGIIRDYRIYPMLAADYRYTGQSIPVTYANPGSDPITQDVDIPDIEFRAVVPAGAETLDPFLAGQSLSLTRNIEGNVDTLKIGDAIVVRQTVKLDGMPAMFIPPLLHYAAAPGLSVYAQEPIVRDDDVATRTEQVTLVFDAGGTFGLPEVTLDWWNVETKRIERASLPALEFSIVGPPVPEIEEHVGEGDPWSVAAVVAAAVAAIALLVWLLPGLRRYLQAAAERRRRSEGYAFRRIIRALSTRDERAVYAALLEWLQRVDPGLSIRDFADRSGDDELRAQLDRLSRSLFVTAGSSADLGKLRRSIARARERCLASRARSTAFALPPLNP